MPLLSPTITIDLVLLSQEWVGEEILESEGGNCLLPSRVRINVELKSHTLFLSLSSDSLQLISLHISLRSIHLTRHLTECITTGTSFLIMADSTTSAAAAKKSKAALAKILRQRNNENTPKFFAAGIVGMIVIFMIFHWSRFFIKRSESKGVSSGPLRVAASISR